MRSTEILSQPLGVRMPPAPLRCAAQPRSGLGPALGLGAPRNPAPAGPGPGRAEARPTPGVCPLSIDQAGFIRSTSPTPALPGQCPRTRCTPSARDGWRARSAQAPGNAGVSPAATATRCAGRSEAKSGPSPTKTLATEPLHPYPRRDAGEPSAGETPAPPRSRRPRDLGTVATSVGGVRFAGMHANARSGSPRTLRHCTTARCRRHSDGDPG